MANHKRRINLTLLDPPKKRMQVRMHVGLAHLKSQALTKSRAKGNLVQQSSVDTGNRNSPTFSASENGLSQNLWAIKLKLENLLGGVVTSYKVVAVRFHANAIYTRIGSTATTL